MLTAPDLGPQYLLFSQHNAASDLGLHCLPLIQQFLDVSITKTCLYNFDSIKTPFYTIKLGFTRYTLFFFISAQKHRLWVLIRGSSNEYPKSVF